MQNNLSKKSNPNLSEFNKLLEMSGLSHEKFGNLIGYSRNRIGQFANNKAKIPDEVIAIAKNKVAQLAKSKLQTLNEPIQKYQKSVGVNNPVQEGANIPFYDIDFIAGNAMEESDGVISSPSLYLFYPEYSGCVAFKIHSNSMEPMIISGSTVFATKVEDRETLEFGEIYGIVLNDGRRLLKYVKRSLKDPESFFDFISHNDFYDPMTIPKNIIKSMWLIHGWVHRKI